ncbi:MAG TPA: glycosyltransferase [Acidobacteriaceae bacterium]
MTYKVVIPTLNAAGNWQLFHKALLESVPADHVLLIDSASSDGTPALAEAAGMEVHSIARSEFDHGGTRQSAIDLAPDAEVLIYLTQDAVLASPDSIRNLIRVFDDPTVGAAYGRQLPHHGAQPLEAHARLFNYPPRDAVRTLEDRKAIGFKAIFISNSFSAYRVAALQAVGGFPRDTIFGEDTITAARLLKAGWKIAYVAEAQVHHSHSYTWRQEFRRYFDIGVLHSREHWLIEEFGGASGEGARFVRSELRYLWPRHWWLIPSALIRTALKLVGYRLGKIESHLPIGLKRRISMNRGYWK